MTIDPAVACLILACAELLFMVAAVHKLRDLPRFAEVFAAYRLLPLSAARRIAPVVPALELAAAIGFMTESLRSMAVCVGVALLFAYGVAIAINLARGRRDLDCGCAGPNNRRPIAAWMVWRNIGLAVFLAAILLPPSDRPLVWTDAVTVGFGTAACALVYLCLDRLLAPIGRVSMR